MSYVQVPAFLKTLQRSPNNRVTEHSGMERTFIQRRADEAAIQIV
jgi:hypothetical protein